MVANALLKLLDKPQERNLYNKTTATLDNDDDSLENVRIVNHRSRRMSSPQNFVSTDHKLNIIDQGHSMEQDILEDSQSNPPLREKLV